MTKGKNVQFVLQVNLNHGALGKELIVSSLRDALREVEQGRLTHAFTGGDGVNSASVSWEANNAPARKALVCFRAR